MASQFDQAADEFVARVRAENIGPSTEVWIIFECTDQRGAKVEPIRIDAAAGTTIRMEGARGVPEAARQFAASLHVGNVCDNIRSLVAGVKPGLTMFAESPGYPVEVRGVSLEIIHAEP